MTDDTARTTAARAGADAPERPASGGPPARWMLPAGLLRPHPGNPRHDLALSPEFLASLRHDGVLVPLRVVPDGENGYWVIDGNRRLAGAVEAGIGEVPCDLAGDRDGDLASQHLDMITTSRHRLGLKPVEQARALFAASQHGATRTKLRQAAGMTAAGLRTALTAGGLSQASQAAAAAAGRALTLEQCALLAEFDDEPEDVARLLETAERGYGLEYEAARIRRERADRARRDQAAADLAAAGVTVTSDLPEGATWLDTLTHDGEELTPDTHARCPGHAAVLSPFDCEPLWYCTAPAAHGHQPRPEQPGSTDQDTLKPDPGARKHVIEGNRAWKASADVRHSWLRDSLLGRRTAPPEAARFLTAQILTMPEPLASGLHTARMRDLYTSLAGNNPGQITSLAQTCPASRLPLLMLTPVVVAYEHALTCDAGKGIWRTDRHTSPIRPATGHYLQFLASVGYHLSSIEKAIADDTTWQGDPVPKATGSAAGSHPELATVSADSS